MKIDDKMVTKRLNDICRQIRATRKEFTPPPPAGRVDADLPTLDAVASLFHPSGILIHEGRPVFAYIRDHIWGEYPGDPAERKKLHFTVCQTLVSMKQGGRFERYRLTNRDDNRYLVDVRGGFERTRELDGQTLYPCKHCLANVGYHCYRVDMALREKDKIVREFEAKEAFRLLWQQFDIFRRQTARLRSARLPTGYADNFRATSLAFRKSRHFTCEQCGVRLAGAYQGLIDTHHDDGDKRNDSYNNLRCLCKLCHAKQHPRHYRVSAHARHIIESARKSQRVSLLN